MSESNELLIQFDKSGFQYQIKNLENFTSFFQSCIDDFNRLKLEPFKDQDFTKFFLVPQSFLFNELMKTKPSSIDGVSLNKEKLYELIEKPIGFAALISKIQTFGDMIATLPKHYKLKFTESPDAFLEYFTIENGKIKLTKDIVERIRYSHEIFISKDSTKNIYKFVNNLEKVFNEAKVFGPNFMPPAIKSGGDIHRFLPYDPETREFHVDIERIKAYDISIDNR